MFVSTAENNSKKRNPSEKSPTSPQLLLSNDDTSFAASADRVVFSDADFTEVINNTHNGQNSSPSPTNNSTNQQQQQQQQQTYPWILKSSVLLMMNNNSSNNNSSNFLTNSILKNHVIDEENNNLAINESIFELFKLLIEIILPKFSCSAIRECGAAETLITLWNATTSFTNDETKKKKWFIHNFLNFDENNILLAASRRRRQSQSQSHQKSFLNNIFTSGDEESAAQHEDASDDFNIFDDKDFRHEESPLFASSIHAKRSLLCALSAISSLCLKSFLFGNGVIYGIGDVERTQDFTTKLLSTFANSIKNGIEKVADFESRSNESKKRYLIERKNKKQREQEHGKTAASCSSSSSRASSTSATKSTASARKHGKRKISRQLSRMISSAANSSRRPSLHFLASSNNNNSINQRRGSRLFPNSLSFRKGAMPSFRNSIKTNNNNISHALDSISAASNAILFFAVSSGAPSTNTITFADILLSTVVSGEKGGLCLLKFVNEQVVENLCLVAPPSLGINASMLLLFCGTLPATTPTNSLLLSLMKDLLFSSATMASNTVRFLFRTMITSSSSSTFYFYNNNLNNDENNTCFFHNHFQNSTALLSSSTTTPMNCTNNFAKSIFSVDDDNQQNKNATSPKTNNNSNNNNNTKNILNVQNHQQLSRIFWDFHSGSTVACSVFAELFSVVAELLSSSVKKTMMVSMQQNLVNIILFGGSFSDELTMPSQFPRIVNQTILIEKKSNNNNNNNESINFNSTTLPNVALLPSSTVKSQQQQQRFLRSNWISLLKNLENLRLSNSNLPKEENDIEEETNRFIFLASWMIRYLICNASPALAKAMIAALLLLLPSSSNDENNNSIISIFSELIVGLPSWILEVWNKRGVCLSDTLKMKKILSVQTMLSQSGLKEPHDLITTSTGGPAEGDDFHDADDAKVKNSPSPSTSFPYPFFVKPMSADDITSCELSALSMWEANFKPQLQFVCDHLPFDSLGSTPSIPTIVSSTNWNTNRPSQLVVGFGNLIRKNYENIARSCATFSTLSIMEHQQVSTRHENADEVGSDDYDENDLSREGDNDADENGKAKNNCGSPSKSLIQRLRAARIERTNNLNNNKNKNSDNNNNKTNSSINTNSNNNTMMKFNLEGVDWVADDEANRPPLLKREQNSVSSHVQRLKKLRREQFAAAQHQVQTDVILQRANSPAFLPPLPSALLLLENNNNNNNNTTKTVAIFSSTSLITTTTTTKNDQRRFTAAQKLKQHKKQVQKRFDEIVAQREQKERELLPHIHKWFGHLEKEEAKPIQIRMTIASNQRRSRTRDEENLARWEEIVMPFQREHLEILEVENRKYFVEIKERDHWRVSIAFEAQRNLFVVSCLQQRRELHIYDEAVARFNLFQQCQRSFVESLDLQERRYLGDVEQGLHRISLHQARERDFLCVTELETRKSQNQLEEAKTRHRLLQIYERNYVEVLEAQMRRVQLVEMDSKERLLMKKLERLCHLAVCETDARNAVAEEESQGERRRVKFLCERSWTENVVTMMAMRRICEQESAGFSSLRNMERRFMISETQNKIATRMILMEEALQFCEFSAVYFMSGFVVVQEFDEFRTNILLAEKSCRFTTFHRQPLPALSIVFDTLLKTTNISSSSSSSSSPWAIPAIVTYFDNSNFAVDHESAYFWRNHRKDLEKRRQDSERYPALSLVSHLLQFEQDKIRDINATSLIVSVTAEKKPSSYQALQESPSHLETILNESIQYDEEQEQEHHHQEKGGADVVIRSERYRDELFRLTILAHYEHAHADALRDLRLDREAEKMKQLKIAEESAFGRKLRQDDEPTGNQNSD